MFEPQYINQAQSVKCRLLNFCLRIFVKQQLAALFAEENPDVQLKQIIKARKRLDRFSIHDISVPQEDVVIDNIQAKWFFCNQRNAPILLYFHGGAYMMGSAKVYSGLCATLAKICRVNVLYFDYALSPENPPLLRIKQSVAIYKNLLKHFQDKNIFFAGDSAGGGLALSTTLFLRNLGLALPKSVICFSPFTDLCFTGESVVKNAQKDPFLQIPKHVALLNRMKIKNKYLSPLYGNFQKFPPLFIQVGADEILFDDAYRVAEKAHAEKVAVTLEIWKHVPHAWPIFAGFLPEAKQALEHVSVFIHSQL